MSFTYALSILSESLEQANNSVTSYAESRKSFRVFHLAKKKSVHNNLGTYFHRFLINFLDTCIYHLCQYARSEYENRFYWVPKWLWKMTFFGLKYGQDLTGRPRPPPPHEVRSTLLLCPPPLFNGPFPPTTTRLSRTLDSIKRLLISL